MATLEPKVTAGAPRTYGALLVGTFVIAVSGLVYELIAGTLSSYLLGDSVYQFSIVIGLFMTAMGLGSYLSRFIGDSLEQAFIVTQIILGLIGGLAALALFFAFVHLDNYEAFLFLICIAIGTLVGLEIPLIIRILKRERTLEINISNILTVDYIGALAAALLFPTGPGPAARPDRHRLPVRHAEPRRRRPRRLAVPAEGRQPLPDRGTRRGGAALHRSRRQRAAGDEDRDQALSRRDHLCRNHPLSAHRRHPPERPYPPVPERCPAIRQRRRAPLSRSPWSTPPMSLASRTGKVLVLGGGDGMAVREVLRHDGVESVTLVDLDPAMTRLFRDHPRLSALNEGALDDPRVEVINQDAFEFLNADDALYDAILIDLPDPKNPSLSKLYSLAFYTAAARRLAQGGVLVTQATSPVYAQKAFWSIFRTIDATGDPYREGETLSAVPYHAYVPSFGDWGFVAASPARLDWSGIRLPAGLRFLTDDTLPGLTRFSPDIDRVPVEINTLQTIRFSATTTKAGPAGSPRRAAPAGLTCLDRLSPPQAPWVGS